MTAALGKRAEVTGVQQHDLVPQPAFFIHFAYHRVVMGSSWLDTAADQTVKPVRFSDRRRVMADRVSRRVSIGAISMASTRM